MLFRYSRWDGSQHLADLDADDLLAAMSDDLMSDGDLWNALRRMFQRGLQNPQGPRMPGLQNLMDRLRKRRQEQLDRYDLGSALEDIKKKLDEVISTERKGIERQVPNANERAKKLEPLDQLPPDPAGRIKQLQDYNFTDPEAERLFQELMKQLQQQMLQPFMQNMKQSLQNMSADDLKRMREMLRDLNQMLRQRAEGDEPDFDAFKQKWGQNFPGVESLDELLEQLGRQAGQLQSLLDSMSPGQRRQLQEMMSSLFMKDERLEAEMAQLAMHLDQLGLTEEFRRRYDFRGDDDLSMQEAMKLMDELQQMEELERQFRRVQTPDDLEKIDPIDVEKLLGEESAQDLERLKELAKKLEEAGYLERKGDRLELTARAIRKLGDKALKDIFASLKRDRFGRHNIERRGAGGDPTDEAKRYEFGDPFLLDLKKTLMNAVERNGAGAPVARRFRGATDRAVHPGLDRGDARHEPLDDQQRLLPAGQKGCARADRAHPRPVPARQPVHPRVLVLGQAIQARGPAEAHVQRVQRRHQHASRLSALAPAPGAAEGRQQADHHDHRRRADRPHDGRRQTRFPVPADARDVRGDAEGSPALHARGHHDQHLHARAEPDAHAVHRTADPHQQGPRVLRQRRPPRRVHPGRLRQEQTPRDRLASRLLKNPTLGGGAA